jgi:hypothetical protein
MKLAWILVGTVATLAMAPLACVIESDPYGPGGTGAGLGYGGGTGTGAGPVGDQCNPVTAAGCPSDGSTCDLDQTTGYFVCFGPPNSVDVCGACDDSTTFCGAGLTCIPSQGGDSATCYRYCCSDADCGSGGTCDTALGKSLLQPTDPADAVGLCIAGTSPACGSATPVSGGSCVGGYTSSGSSTGATTSSGGVTSTSSSGGTGGSPGDGGTTDDDGGAGGGSGSSSATGSSSGSMIPDGGHAGRHDGGWMPGG